MMSERTSDIDFVMIWVDGSDPQWQITKAHYKGEDPKFNVNNVRYRDWGLLHYWFRAVEKYAPWVRKIHFVTCGQTPKWLQTEHPKLHLVNHSDYIDAEFLPTFSANPIELNLHRIEGLSEKFVFFNDDMFLTAPTTPEDFFVGDLPRGCAVLNPPSANRYGIGTIVMNDLGIIVDHFDFWKQFRENRGKWLNSAYGKQNLRTMLLLPWRRFVGIYDLHIGLPLLKSTFREVWAAEEPLLRKVSANRFRSDSDVNVWLMEYWQLLKGTFVPESPKIGRMFYSEREMDQIVEVLKNQSMKEICINDSEKIEDFEAYHDRLVEAFDTHLKEKSSFEK